MNSDTPLIRVPRAFAGRAFGGLDRTAAFAAILLVAIAIPCVFAGVFAPYDPAAQPDIIGLQSRPPSLAHPFGTDQFSRDVLSRLMHGGGVSLMVATLATLVSVTLGTAYGGLAGFVGGWASSVLERILDSLLAIPRLLFLIAVFAAWRDAPIAGFVVVLGVTGWYGLARLVRGQVLSLRTEDFVTSARALGATRKRIFVRHILPNVVTPVVVAATLGVGRVIVLEAGLSWLGLGVHPPDASWGNMIQDGSDQLATHWWIALFPGLAILVTVMAFNVLGDALLRALSPRRSMTV
jgi:peptide/nickel transport system permease protein